MSQIISPRICSWHKHFWQKKLVKISHGRACSRYSEVGQGWKLKFPFEMYIWNVHYRYIDTFGVQEGIPITLRLQDTFAQFSSDFQELPMDKRKSCILKNSKLQYTRAALVVHLQCFLDMVKMPPLHWRMIVLKECVRAIWSLQLFRS